MNYSESEERPAIVMDIGSRTCKAGFAGEDEPSCLLSTVVRRPRCGGDKPPPSIGYYVGDSRPQDESSSLHYPMEHGIVTNWEDMEKVIHHLIHNELKVEPQEHGFLLTEAPLNPMSNRQRMIQLMFEKFNVAAFYVVNPALLSIYSWGRFNGTVLDCGDGVTHVYPVSEGVCLSHAVERIDLAGRDVTNYLAKLLRERDYSFSTSGELEIVRDMKEQLGYVSCDYAQDLYASRTYDKTETGYRLPDGQVITVGNERFRAPEIMFQPSLIGMDTPGVHELVYNSIMKCEIDTRKDLFAPIIVTGGTAMCPGFVKRLEKEMTTLAPEKAVLRFRDHQDKIIAAWVGGSILASLSTFSKMWITRPEYDEHGPNIVHRKCF